MYKEENICTPDVKKATTFKGCSFLFIVFIVVRSGFEPELFCSRDRRVANYTIGQSIDTAKLIIFLPPQKEKEGNIVFDVNLFLRSAFCKGVFQRYGTIEN